jgi:hypothetical protein
MNEWIDLMGMDIFARNSVWGKDIAGKRGEDDLEIGGIYCYKDCATFSCSGEKRTAGSVKIVENPLAFKNASQ